MTRTICLLIVFIVSGAAQALAQSNADAPIAATEYWQKYAMGLPIGTLVRVKLQDGKRVKLQDGKRVTGTLAVVDDNGVTIARKTRVPEAPRVISFTELAQLEPRNDGGVNIAKAVAIGAAVGAGTFLAILLVAVSQLD
jgi:hypothetical protein